MPFAPFSHPVTAHVLKFVQIFFAYHAFGSYIGYPTLTHGPSMLPTLNVQGDYVWISSLHQHGKGVKIGDLVRVMHPQRPNEGIIKRLIGMPGDFVLRNTPSSGSDAMVQVRFYVASVFASARSYRNRSHRATAG